MHLKCNFSVGSVVNGIRYIVLYSLAAVFYIVLLQINHVVIKDLKTHQLNFFKELDPFFRTNNLSFRGQQEEYT